jgi:tape measure domain-containing protein
MEDIARLGLAIESSQVRTATANLERLQQQATSTERAAARTTTSFNAMQTAARGLAGVVAAIGVSVLTSRLSELSDAGVEVANSLKIVTTSTAELAAMQSKILAISNDTRSSYEATASLYSKLTRSTQDLNISEERRLRVTELINKSFAASGASAEEAGNAIRQLAQGLSAGALRGDEFNSVAEQAPEILKAVAAQTGKSSGQLREFAATGGITAKLLIESVENYGATIDRIYTRSGATRKNYETIARNNAIREVEASRTIQAASQAYGETIVYLSESLGELAQAGVAVAGVLGVAMLQSVVKSTAASIQATAATAARVAAENAAAAAVLRGAAAEKAAAGAALVTARAQFLAAQGTTAHTFAQVALTAAKTRSLTAMAAYNVALQGTIVNSTRLAAVSSFMLGPWGLLITVVGVAAATFLLAKDASAETADQLDRDTAVINKLAESYSRLSEKARGTESVRLHTQLAEVTAELARQEADLASQVGKGMVANLLNAEAILQQKQRVEELTAEKVALSDKLAALNKLFEDGLDKNVKYTDATRTTAKAAAEVNKEFISVRDSLAMQIVELTLSADAYERYAAQVQVGSKTSAAERANIDAMIVRLQALRKEKETEVKQKETVSRFSELRLEIAADNNPAEKLKQELDKRLEIIRKYQATEGADQAAALDQQKAAYAKFYEDIETLNKKNGEKGFLTTITDSLASFKDQASGTLASVALGFQDGDDAARQLATTVLTQLTGAMINYGIEQVVAYATGAAAATTAEGIKTAAVVSSVTAQSAAALTAQGVVTTGAVASGAAIATAMAPAAAASSIASFGAAPAAATPIALGSIAAIIAAIVGGMAIMGRAQGGQVTAGQTYKFNERGPELFTPKSSGSVTPFNQLLREARGSQGGEGTQVYVDVRTDVSTIDSSSFSDIVNENAAAIAKAVQKALAKQGRRL